MKGSHKSKIEKEAGVMKGRRHTRKDLENRGDLQTLSRSWRKWQKNKSMRGEI